MRRSTRYIAALAVLLFAGACGTAADTPLSPDAGPRMDENGGYAVGGNISGDTSDEETQTMTTQSDTTSRGGGYAVGGN
jgi:hypothetical protein